MFIQKALITLVGAAAAVQAYPGRVDQAAELSRRGPEKDGLVNRTDISQKVTDEQKAAPNELQERPEESAAPSPATPSPATPSPAAACSAAPVQLAATKQPGPGEMTIKLCSPEGPPNEDGSREVKVNEYGLSVDDCRRYAIDCAHELRNQSHPLTDFAPVKACVDKKYLELGDPRNKKHLSLVDPRAINVNRFASKKLTNKRKAAPNELQERPEESAAPSPATPSPATACSAAPVQPAATKQPGRKEMEDKLCAATGKNNKYDISEAECRSRAALCTDRVRQQMKALPTDFSPVEACMDQLLSPSEPRAIFV